MPLAPATRLGPYEIIAPLGAGGMGEVYRARDPRLGEGPDSGQLRGLSAELQDEILARTEQTI